MAYGDYIPCCECKEKLIYDGYWILRSNLEERYGTSDILCPKCIAALRARLAEPEFRPTVGDLLAVIHGDGGHHLGRVGLAQAVSDAIDRVYAERALLAEYSPHSEEK